MGHQGADSALFTSLLFFLVCGLKGADVSSPSVQIAAADALLLWCFQAFSWWPELMVEHAETFLSLYRADMDAALQAQPIDSWNSFPLFQLLNNFLRSDGERPSPAHFEASPLWRCAVNVQHSRAH